MIEYMGLHDHSPLFIGRVDSRIEVLNFRVRSRYRGYGYRTDITGGSGNEGMPVLR